MNDKPHAITMDIERDKDHIYVSFVAKGKLTHKDYQAIVPTFESIVGTMEDPKIHMYVNLEEMEGWEMQAALDDFKLGMEHVRDFEKVAIVGSNFLQKWASKLGAWMVSGELKFFEDKKEALVWLKA